MAKLESMFCHKANTIYSYLCVSVLSSPVTLQTAFQHHFLNGYDIHIPYVGMEVEITFLQLWNVLYERAEDTLMASDPCRLVIFLLKQSQIGPIVT